MQLKKRNILYIIPRYSLTGDILSYQRCGLQYRFYNGSSLPPSRPVQFWTGEFVHNCLEDAYSIWIHHKSDPRFSFPWPMNITSYPKPDHYPQRVDHDIGTIGDRVEARLSAMQKNPRSDVARQAAYNRVYAAVNILAPHLFPLITAVEQKISGTRTIPGHFERADKYELFGIADVISHIEYQANPENQIIRLLSEFMHSLDGAFDIIVDYKASRRPNVREELQDHHKWQIQTYSWLRGQVSNNVPIKAGIIVYINELFPTKSDLIQLKREIANKVCDIIPQNGSPDYYALYRWQENDPLPVFSNEFLIRRALRFVSSTPSEATAAVQNIDAIVNKIESCVESEHNSGSILDNWEVCFNSQDCAACDFRRFCTPPGQSSWHVQAPG